jgi:hypothetical protein
VSTFQPIGLGDRVKDPISGASGIVVAVSRYLTGSIRIGVTPETTKDNKPVENIDFDQSAVLLVKAAVHRPMVAIAGGEIGLGDRVKAKVTGLRGIVDSETTWLHGCRRYGVKPEGLHEGREIDRHYFDEPELELIDRGVHKPLQLQVAPAPMPETRRSNGGPVRETVGFRR